MTRDWAGRRVLVTGGLGFLGSALVRALVAEGAQVRVLDSLLPHFGGSPANVRSVADRVDVVIEDTRNRDAVNRAVENVDVIYHLASAAGPGAGGSDFYADLDVSCMGTWHVLEAMRLFTPAARVVMASSHHVYAPECTTSVTEDAPTGPDTLFGVHKLAGEAYGGLFRRASGLDVVIARLSNVFGPRQRLQSAGFGSLARVFDAALHGEPAYVFDRGDQRSDYLFVDDAIDVMLFLGASSTASAGMTVNVGAGRCISTREAAAAVYAAIGSVQPPPTAPVITGEHSLDRGFIPDLGRLRELGVAPPARSFEDEVAETARWYLGERG